MVAIEFDYLKCDKCGKCVRICCNSNVIAYNEDGYPYYKDMHKCISCGHCVSICPQNAISSKSTKPIGADHVFTKGIEVTQPKYDIDEIRQLLFGLRSTRFFSDDAITIDAGNRIVEAMINSPSAGNEQNRNYYVLSTAEKIRELEADIQNAYTAKAAALKNPILRKITGAVLKKHIKAVLSENNINPSETELTGKANEVLDDLAKQKDDFYCRKAPLIIMVTSNTQSKGMHKDFYKSDAQIAVTHGAIMASALGIASCRLGLVEMEINKSKQLLKKYGIQENEKVNGIIAFGHSTEKWYRTPSRGPAKTIWV